MKRLTGRNIAWVFLFALACGLVLYVCAKELGRDRTKEAGIVHVQRLDPLLGLADPVKDNIGFRGLMIKVEATVPEQVFLTMEDSAENSIRTYQREESRPADWIGKFGAVSVSASGVLSPMTIAEWQAVGVPSVPLGEFAFFRKTEQGWKDLKARVEPHLAGKHQAAVQPTKDFKVVSVLSSTGSLRLHSSLPGMGRTAVAHGECHVQVHRESDGRPVGPIFHLVGATDRALWLRGSWIIDGQWIMWHDDQFMLMWVIHHDWNKDLAAMEQEPAPVEAK